jgi:predicted nucleotidyltransferase component of viral defense system
MINKGEISKIARKHQIGDAQIEKDYVITWVLCGISQNEILKEILAFKGGTVLKKAYFPDYRFSEDLDFTLLREDLSNEQIVNAFNEVCEFVQDETGMTLKINIEKDKEHKETNGFKFFIDYVGPLQGAFGSRDLKVDITRKEILEFDLEEKSIFSEYSDFGKDFHVKCYKLSEVLIEKMAAVMGRTIPRDIYDLWYLLEVDGMSLDEHIPEFERKAKNKNQNPELFKEKLKGKEEIYKRDWNRSLEKQVRELRGFEEILRELNKHFRKL